MVDDSNVFKLELSDCHTHTHPSNIIPEQRISNELIWIFLKRPLMLIFLFVESYFRLMINYKPFIFLYKHLMIRVFSPPIHVNLANGLSMEENFSTQQSLNKQCNLTIFWHLICFHPLQFWWTWEQYCLQMEGLSDAARKFLNHKVISGSINWERSNGQICCSLKRLGLGTSNYLIFREKQHGEAINKFSPIEEHIYSSWLNNQARRSLRTLQ